MTPHRGDRTIVGLADEYAMFVDPGMMSSSFFNGARSTDAWQEHLP
jgi:hypothetical protein